MKDETQACDRRASPLGCAYTALGGFFPKDPQDAGLAHLRARLQRHRPPVQRQRPVHRVSQSQSRVGEVRRPHRDADPAHGTRHRRSGSRSTLTGFNTAAPTPRRGSQKSPAESPCVHLKDMGITNAREPFMMEVGEGNLNWPAILKACKAGWGEVVHRRAGHMLSRSVRQPRDELEEPSTDG